MLNTKRVPDSVQLELVTMRCREQEERISQLEAALAEKKERMRTETEERLAKIEEMLEPPRPEYVDEFRNECRWLVDKVREQSAQIEEWRKSPGINSF